MLYGCIYLEILDLRDSPVVKVPDYRKHLILSTRRLGLSPQPNPHPLDFMT